MEDDRLDALGETKAPATSGTRREGPIEVAAVGNAPRAAATGADDAIRSVYVARAVAATNKAGVATLDVASDGGAVRGAYLTHRFDGHVESVGGGEIASEVSLRGAYVAHLTAAAQSAGSAGMPRPRPGNRTRRKAS